MLVHPNPLEIPGHQREFHIEVVVIHLCESVISSSCDDHGEEAVLCLPIALEPDIA